MVYFKSDIILIYNVPPLSFELNHIHFVDKLPILNTVQFSLGR